MQRVLALLSPIWIATAAAGCPGGGKVLFSCPTKAGRQIQLCDEGARIRYSFGSIATALPEIVVSVARGEASTTQWNGIGRYMRYSVEVPNEDITYSVFFSADRLGGGHGIEAGVRVLRGGELLATVRCVGADLENNMEGLGLKPTPR